MGTFGQRMQGYPLDWKPPANLMSMSTAELAADKRRARREVRRRERKRHFEKEKKKLLTRTSRKTLKEFRRQPHYEEPSFLSPKEINSDQSPFAESSDQSYKEIGIDVSNHLYPPMAPDFEDEDDEHGFLAPDEVRDPTKTDLGWWDRPGREWSAAGFLGSGGEGRCALFRRPTVDGALRGDALDHIVVKDVYRKDESANTFRPLNEALYLQTLNQVRSKNIIRLWKYKWSVKSKVHRLYLEHCDVGNLEELMRNHRTSAMMDHPEPFLWALIYALSRAIYALQSGKVDESFENPNWRRIIHRDLKPSNIFMKRREDPKAVWPYFKVADFGYATKTFGWTYGQFNSPSAIGTPGFQPPEQLKASAQDQIVLQNGDATQRKFLQAIRKRISGKTNVWGLGAILGFVLEGRGQRPFRLDESLDEDPLSDPDEKFTEEIADLTRACLAPDPDYRPTPTRIVTRAMDMDRYLRQMTLTQKNEGVFAGIFPFMDPSDQLWTELEMLDSSRQIPRDRISTEWPRVNSPIVDEYANAFAPTPRYDLYDTDSTSAMDESDD